MDFTYIAKAINRILEINQTLPNDEKIKDGKTYKLGTVVNPEKLIEKLQ